MNARVALAAALTAIVLLVLGWAGASSESGLHANVLAWIWLALVPLFVALALGRPPARALTAPAMIALIIVAVCTCVAVSAFDREGLFSLPARIYDPSFTGYFQDAARFETPGEVWRDYSARHAALFPHSKAHPPGPVTFFWLTTRLAHAATKALDRLGCFRSEADRALFGFKLEGNIPGYLIPLLASFWIWPLAAAGRSLFGPDGSRLASSVAIAIPAMLLSVPNIDQLFPLFAALPLLWLERAVAGDRRLPACAAGAGWALALTFSFGFLALPLGYLAFSVLRSGPGRDRRRGLRAMLLFGVAAVCVFAAIVVATGYDAVAGFDEALGSHAGLESVTSRYSYAWSLVGGPAGFLLGLGPPLALACVWALWGVIRVRGWTDPRQAPAVAAAILILVLTVLGTTRTETMRLWLPILPFVVLACVGVVLARWRPGRLDAGIAAALGIATTIGLKAWGSS